MVSVPMGRYLEERLGCPPKGGSKGGPKEAHTCVCTKENAPVADKKKNSPVLIMPPFFKTVVAQLETSLQRDVHLSADLPRRGNSQIELPLVEKREGRATLVSI